MTAGLAIILVCFGMVLGWIAHQFELDAAAERWAEKPGPRLQPMSHCHPIVPPFDQDVAQ